MILASQSPRRRELLAQAGYSFTVEASSFDESLVEFDDPVRLVSELAHKKAAAVFEKHPEELVIGSDTVVCLDGRVLGKPADAEDARRMLHALAGRRHTVHTGVAVLSKSFEETFVDSTDVEFWPLADDEIDAYVATGEPLDKAGAYGIQDRGRLLVKAIFGDYYTVVGLPVSRLVRLLREHGVRPDR